MKIAIPTDGERLTPHFGHCRAFAVVEADQGKIVSQQTLDAPPHQPGLLPKWLGDMGVNVVIAGGMGGRAQALFAERGISVVTGAPSEEPAKVVEAYLMGSLETGDNICDH